MNHSYTIALAAGGTGGHIFPAEALAEELQSQGHKVVLVTDRRATEYKNVLGSLERYTVRAGTLGRGLTGKLTAAAEIFMGTMQARSLLKRLKPDAVVGFGGYPSFPTVYAARGLKIPTIIHEQNSVLGRANRLLLKRADLIATSFPHMRLIEEPYAARTVLVGNPVRSTIRLLRDIPYPELSQDGHIRILVTGGSQGASIFSQIIPAAIAALPGALRSRIRIDQQCREADLSVTRAAYTQMNVSADLASFFSDIPVRLASAHLVIARAGASTIAELTVAGRPSILVPLPSAMDNHQYHNANALEESGAGWMMPQEGFTAASLSTRIEAFLTLPESLSRAAARAKLAGRVHAASDLAAYVIRLASGESASSILHSEPVERSA